MSDECNDKPWFTPYIVIRDDLPAGFLEWTEGITQEKYTIFLPGGDKVSAKFFLDHQKVFDGGSYTTYLINRYNGF